MEADVQDLASELAAAQQRAEEAEHRFLALYKLIGFPPGHYYSPIPDLHAVAAADSLLFARHGVRADLPEIDLNEARQIELVRELATYTPIKLPAERESGWRYHSSNMFYSKSDATVFANMLRKARPKRMIEIGSGFSSALALDINDRYLDGGMSFTFVDPDSSRLRELLFRNDDQRATIIDDTLQNIDLEQFRNLEENDILFIDSSHVSKIGSDVSTILFRILPLLRPGIYIHFHAIFYPFEYPSEWIYEGRFWNEAYFLRAYLARNRAYEIALFSNFLSQCRSEEFAKLSASHATDGCASFWMRKLLD